MASLRGRVRPIQQMEQSECGIACLAMILDLYGCSKSLKALRESCGTSRDGNSALQLVKGAQRHGLSARGVRLEPEALGALRLPAILHWDLNHFVVLERYRRGRARIVDPANGRVEVDAETLDRSFSGVALELEPTPELQRQPRQAPSLRKYFAELDHVKAPLLFLAVAGAAEQLLGVVSPAVSQLLIDEVIRPARTEWLLPLLSVAVLATAAELWLSCLYGLALASLQSALGFALTDKLGTHLLRLPLSFVESRSRGDLLDRASSQAGLGKLLGTTVLGAFDLFFVVALTALMLAYDARLALLTLGIDLLRIVVVRVFREDVRQRAAGEIAAEAREHAVVLEATSSAELIKAFGIEPAVRAWYARRLAERLRWTVRTARRGTATARLLSVFDAASRALVLWWGGNRVIDGQMTLGVFAGFLAIRALVSGPLGSLVSTFESWLSLQNTLARAEDLFEEPAIVEGAQRPRRMQGKLELEGVGFRYGSGGAWVLRNVSFSIEPGQHAVFVGPSGQGKSTLLRIAAGLLEPTEGRVLLDGVELRHYAPEALAEQVGSLVGEPLVLAGSIHENLTLRVPHASQAAVERAARVCCFDEVVAKLPRGGESLLEAQGSNLSGGERQRLGLAQAVLNEPALLFLDEATCSLDAATEARVIENLRRSGATLVSVAHRPAVIRAAERVFEVGDGQVRERQVERAFAAARAKGHLTLLENVGSGSTESEENPPCKLQHQR